MLIGILTVSTFARHRRLSLSASGGSQHRLGAGGEGRLGLDLDRLGGIAEQGAERFDGKGFAGGYSRCNGSGGSNETVVAASNTALA